MKLLVVNGPNMARLGEREAEHYGTFTLEKLNAAINSYVGERGWKTEFFQSNHEGFIIDRLEKGDFDALLINPAALTHYGFSLADALRIITCPKAEVHLSDIFSREEFRRVRVTQDCVDALFYGEKELSYLKGAKFLMDRCEKIKRKPFRQGYPI